MVFGTQPPALHRGACRLVNHGYSASQLTEHRPADVKHARRHLPNDDTIQTCDSPSSALWLTALYSQRRRYLRQKTRIFRAICIWWQGRVGHLHHASRPAPRGLQSFTILNYRTFHSTNSVNNFRRNSRNLLARDVTFYRYNARNSISADGAPPYTPLGELTALQKLASWTWGMRREGNETEE